MTPPSAKRQSVSQQSADSYDNQFSKTHRVGGVMTPPYAINHEMSASSRYFAPFSAMKFFRSCKASPSSTSK